MGYSPIPQNSYELKNNIKNVIDGIPQEMLQYSYWNIQVMFQKCLDLDGCHIQQFL